MEEDRVIGVPVETSAGRIVFIADEIGDFVPDDERVEIGRLGKQRVWASNEVIEEVQEENVGLDLYGFWHVALLSGWVERDPDRRLAILRQPGNTGLYLFLSQDGSLVEETGHIVAGEPATESDEILGLLADESAVQEVYPDFGRTTLPKRPALSAARLMEQEEREKEKALFHAVVIGFAVAAGAAATDWSLKRSYESALMDVQSAQSALQADQDRLADLERERILEYPDDSLRLETLSALYLRDHNLEFVDGSAVDLGAEDPVSALVSEKTPVDDLPVSWALRPDGKVEVVIP